MLGVYLREAKHFAVGEFSSHFSAYTLEVLDLVAAQCQPFAIVIRGNVINIDHLLRLPVDGKEGLIEPGVLSLQHRIKIGCTRALFRDILLYPANTFYAHVSRDLHGARAPRGDHFAAGPNKWLFE